MSDLRFELSDEVRATLDSIATQLAGLAERHLLDEINEDDYAFAVNDLLSNVPTVSAPANVQVMHRVKDWHSARLITAEQSSKLLNELKRTDAIGASGAGPSGSSIATTERANADAVEIVAPPPAASAGKRPMAHAIVPATKAVKKESLSNLKQTTLFLGSAFGLDKGRMSPAVSVAASLPSPRSFSPVPPADTRPASAPPAKRGRADEAVKQAVVSVKLRFVGGTSSVALNLTIKSVQASLQGVKNKRRVYSGKEKVAAVEATSTTASDREAAKTLSNTAGYEKVQGRQLKQWRTASVPKKRGPKVNHSFRRDVLDQLIYTQVAAINDPSAVAVVANVAYSYEVVKIAAQKVQQMPEYKDDVKVQALKFSPPWIQDFLEEHTLHRRRVSTTEKELPPVPDVQATMKGIAEAQVDFERGETISADETAVFYGSQPKNQYVPEGEKRGAAPATDEKARYTSMQAGGDDGEMLPSFNIVKCSSKKADLSGTRVLKTLHTSPGFTAEEGWDLLLWQRTLTILNRSKQKITVQYVRPYLKQKDSQIIITIQHKAWMDTAGIAMWIDLLIGPHFAKKRKRCLLVWDNCGSHCVDAIKPVLAAWGITEKKLPKNMTGKLQVMDLVVNGPYKAAVRKQRIMSLFDYFQNWKIARLQEQAKAPEERNLPPFDPPKPDLNQGLCNSFAVERELFAKADFKAALKKVFVNTGQAPQADGTYVIYKSHARSTIAADLIPLGKTEEASLGSIVPTADFAACEDEDEPATDDEVEGEGDEE